MNEPPYIISVFDYSGMYEVRLEGTIIKTIKHFSKDTQSMTDLNWSDLGEEVRWDIITKVREKLKP